MPRASLTKSISDFMPIGQENFLFWVCNKFIAKRVLTQLKAEQLISPSVPLNPRGML